MTTAEKKKKKLSVNINFIKSARDATHVHKKYTKRAHKYKLLI
jgi:hypothetical protein